MKKKLFFVVGAFMLLLNLSSCYVEVADGHRYHHMGWHRHHHEHEARVEVR